MVGNVVALSNPKIVRSKEALKTFLKYESKTKPSVVGW